MPDKNPKIDARPIILTGFMGTGKSAVGSALAARLGRAFLDTDALIEAEAGKSIPEIFADEGEAAFRKLESEAIDRALREASAVIAVGGGAVCFPANFRKLDRGGRLVLLTADAATILARTARETHRPLLAGADKGEKVRALLRAREKDYGRIPMKVKTDGKSVAAVSSEIAARLGLEGDALNVRLGARTYPIYFREKNADRILPELLKTHVPATRAVLVSNPTVFRLHGARFLKALKKEVRVEKILIPDGERHKNFKTLAKLYDQLARLGIDRKTPVIALGGGVIGDVVGFAAASYLRGVPFVQIPTTLLAQVDSSIGGKTGIDLAQGKNLVGAFYQPKFVLIEEAFLQTLPARELRCGLSEVIKYAAIFDAELFRRLESAVPEALRRSGAGLMPIVRKCCEWKAWVVEKDELDTLDLRAKLNFGHTLGHAVETLTHYRKFTHGEAVAMGMVFAAEKSRAETGLKDRDVARLRALLETAGLPVALPKFPKVAYRKALSLDKKRVSSFIHFVYLKKIGSAVVKPTPLAEII